MEARVRLATQLVALSVDFSEVIYVEVGQSGPQGLLQNLKVQYINPQPKNEVFAGRSDEFLNMDILGIEINS